MCSQGHILTDGLFLILTSAVREMLSEVSIGQSFFLKYCQNIVLSKNLTFFNTCAQKLVRTLLFIYLTTCIPFFVLRFFSIFFSQFLIKKRQLKNNSQNNNGKVNIKSIVSRLLFYFFCIFCVPISLSIFNFYFLSVSKSVFK